MGLPRVCTQTRTPLRAKNQKQEGEIDVKKIISIALALLMVAVMLPVMAMAEGVTDEAGLKTAVAAGGNIKLANNIKLTETLVVNTTVVLDMNGHKLYNDDNIWNEGGF